jgi:uncharacterized protein
MTEKTDKLEFSALYDPRYPVHRVAGRLEPYLRIIVERFHPEKIILFGSYAYGQPTQDSDFDLLVVRREIPSTKAGNMELRYAICDVDAPLASFTFLSRTPEQVEGKLRERSPFFQTIMRKGLVLYAAQAN